MQRKKIFISSVQSEFAAERQILFEYLTTEPANPLIAEAMYLRGTIERMGTGTEEMTKQCLAKGLNKPEFVPHYGFQTTIRRAVLQVPNLEKDLEKGTEKVTEKVIKSVEKKLGEKLGENRMAILSFMQETPTITIPEIAQKLGISETAVQNNIKKLKILGAIQRIGPDKGGYWKVKM